MELFGDEWLVAARSALADLPTVDGADGDLDYVVTGAPGGKVVIGVGLANGRVDRLDAGGSDDPDVVVTLGAATAEAILRGARSADSSYMDGSVKVEGDHRRWLLELRTTRAAALEALAPVMEATDPTG